MTLERVWWTIRFVARCPRFLCVCFLSIFGEGTGIAFLICSLPQPPTWSQRETTVKFCVRAQSSQNSPSDLQEVDTLNRFRRSPLVTFLMSFFLTRLWPPHLLTLLSFRLYSLFYLRWWFQCQHWLAKTKHLKINQSLEKQAGSTVQGEVFWTLSFLKRKSSLWGEQSLPSDGII